jgi:hypothetical protein
MAKPRPAASFTCRRVSPEEALKDMLQLLARNAWAGIGYCNLDKVGIW